MDTVEVAAAMGVVIDIICKDGDLIHPYMLDQSMGALDPMKSKIYSLLLGASEMFTFRLISILVSHGVSPI